MALALVSLGPATIFWGTALAVGVVAWARIPGGPGFVPPVDRAILPMALAFALPELPLCVTRIRPSGAVTGYWGCAGVPPPYHTSLAEPLAGLTTPT